MTCHELRLYFEDPLRMDAELPCAAEHLAHCAECARFVEARHELGAGLRLRSRVSPRTFCGARGGCSGELPATDHGRSATCAIEETPIHGSLLDRGGGRSAGSCGRSSFHPARRLEISNLKMESPQLPVAQPVTSDE